jgi:hypothetical protein
MLGLIMARLGLGGCVAVILAGLLGIQSLRLSMAHHAAEKAQAGWDTCRGKLTSQDAALAAQSARSAAALESAAKAQKAIAPLAAHVASQAKALAGVIPKGADRCARWEDADAQVKAGLQ